MNNMLRIILLVILMILDRISCLRLMEFHVPTHVAIGGRASLSCRWRLGTADVLYSVKWYKDGREFFRHVPREQQSRRKFPLPGVDVEHSDSTGSNITLGPATTATEGRYRCEVSGEKPLFPTVSEHADMIVVALPDHGPIISGTRPKYKVGDAVWSNCTSGKTRPATYLLWYVNGDSAPMNSLKTFHQHHADGNFTTTLQLNFTINKNHFRNGLLKLKCLATIGSVYWRSNEESAQLEKIKSYEIISMRKRTDSKSNAMRKVSQITFLVCFILYFS